MASRHGQGDHSVHDALKSATRPASQASGVNSMFAQRVTLEFRKTTPANGGLGRLLRLATVVTVLPVPWSGCGTGALWDKFLVKDDTFIEEPAHNLYNEGLYLMNLKNEPKAAPKRF